MAEPVTSIMLLFRIRERITWELGRGGLGLAMTDNYGVDGSGGIAFRNS